jgi:hypothetical protein
MIYSLWDIYIVHGDFHGDWKSKKQNWDELHQFLGAPVRFHDEVTLLYFRVRTSSSLPGELGIDQTMKNLQWLPWNSHDYFKTAKRRRKLTLFLVSICLYWIPSISRKWWHGIRIHEEVPIYIDWINFALVSWVSTSQHFCCSNLNCGNSHVNPHVQYLLDLPQFFWYFMGVDNRFGVNKM